MKNELSIYLRLIKREIKAFYQHREVTEQVHLGNILFWSALVEKNFTWLDNTPEDQSNNYPKPKLG